MEKKLFEECYKDVIPSGKLKQYKIHECKKNGHPLKMADTSHDVSIVEEGKEPYRFGTFHHAHYAGFVEDLVNAYRNGDLVWKSDVDKSQDDV